MLKPLLESLDPAVMPIPGAEASSALPLALELLGEERSRGSVLFVNDGFAASQIWMPLLHLPPTQTAPGVFALVIGSDEGGVALLPDGTPVAGRVRGASGDEGRCRRASASAWKPASDYRNYPHAHG